MRNGSLTAKDTSLSNLGSPSCQLHASIDNIQTPSPCAFTAAKGKNIAKYDIESSIVKSLCFYLFLVYIKRITRLSFSLRLRITFPGYITLCHYLSSREIWALENKLHSIIYLSCQSFPPCRWSAKTLITPGIITEMFNPSLHSQCVKNRPGPFMHDRTCMYSIQACHLFFLLLCRLNLTKMWVFNELPEFHPFLLCREYKYLLCLLAVCIRNRINPAVCFIICLLRCSH